MKPEAQLQRAVCEYLTLMCPDVLFWSSSNGLYIGSGANRFAHIANAKAMGMKNGTPDLAFHYRIPSPQAQQSATPFWIPRVLYLELKAEKGKLSADQMAMHGRLRLLGFEVDVIRSLDELRAAIKKRGMPCREALRSLGAFFWIWALQ